MSNKKLTALATLEKDIFRIVLDYCEGKDYFEAPRNPVPEMVTTIIHTVLYANKYNNIKLNGKGKIT